MKYYFLASYLPELHRDDVKVKISLAELLEERFHIPEADWKEIELVLLGRDILILDGLLKGKTVEMEHSLHDREFWREEIKDPKEGPDFIVAYLNSRDRETYGIRESDLLRAAYIDYVLSKTESRFLSGYFTFQRDTGNIFAAKRAKKKGLDISDHLMGEGELVELLKTSREEDFGLEETYPWLESLNRAETPHRQQEVLYQILWDYLDEHSGPDIFHFNVILVYLLKLEILHRKLALSEEEGMAKVRRLGGM